MPAPTFNSATLPEPSSIVPAELARLVAGADGQRAGAGPVVGHAAAAGQGADRNAAAVEVERSRFSRLTQPGPLGIASSDCPPAASADDGRVAAVAVGAHLRTGIPEPSFVRSPGGGEDAAVGQGRYLTLTLSRRERGTRLTLTLSRRERGRGLNVEGDRPVKGDIGRERSRRLHPSQR